MFNYEQTVKGAKKYWKESTFNSILIVELWVIHFSSYFDEFL